MKSLSKTEQEMQAEEAPSPKTLQELTEYIQSLTEREHDYGTCVYAMSLAATATFNHVASNLGVTGFQASCADLDILRRTRSLECPFIIIKAEDALYPQYDLHATLQEAMNGWKEWLTKRAKEEIAKSRKHTVHVNVMNHWKNLAS